jgi:hypothetical protein
VDGGDVGVVEAGEGASIYEKNMSIDPSDPRKNIWIETWAQAGIGTPGTMTASARATTISLIIGPYIDLWSLWSEGDTGPFYNGVLTQGETGA